MLYSLLYSFYTIFILFLHNLQIFVFDIFYFSNLVNFLYIIHKWLNVCNSVNKNIFINYPSYNAWISDRVISRLSMTWILCCLSMVQTFFIFLLVDRIKIIMPFSSFPFWFWEGRCFRYFRIGACHLVILINWLNRT